MHSMALARALSANELFKLQYGRTLQWSAFVALVVLTLAVILMPEYRPTPYSRPLSPTRLIDIELEAVPLDIPKPQTRIKVPLVTIAPDDDPDAVDTIEFPELIPWDTPFFPDVPLTDDTPFVAASQNPRLLRGAVAEYPEMARLAGVQGLVMVKVLVGIDGRVQRVELLKGVHPLIDRPALAAARRLEFAPGTQRDNPVQCWMGVPFRFVLD